MGEIALTVVLMAIAAASYLASAGFSDVGINPADIGPAAVPRLMAGLVILLGVVQLVISLSRRKSDRIIIPNKRGLAAGVILIFLYVFLMPIVGYLYATPLFVFILMGLLGNRKWLQMILVSAAFTGIAYAIFYKFLRVALPL
jgi:putative tricarboxylic transport membrane protein